MKQIGVVLGQDGKVGGHVARVMQWQEQEEKVRASNPQAASTVNFGEGDREAEERREPKVSQDRTTSIRSKLRLATMNIRKTGPAERDKI